MRRTMAPAERINSAARRLSSSSTSVDVLLTSLEKVVASPHVEKYRKVSLANPVMRELAPGAMELLHATGWESHFGYLLLNCFDKALLETGVSALRAVRSQPAYIRDKERTQREAAAAHSTAKEEASAARLRSEFARRVPEEPAEDSAGVAKVCIHMADGSTVWRRFETWDTLNDLLNFVRSLPGTSPNTLLENITMKPAQVLSEKHLKQTIQGLDLWPAGHVRVVSCAA